MDISHKSYLNFPVSWLDNKDDEDLAVAMEQVIPQKEPHALDLPGPSVQVEVKSNMLEPHPPATITARSITKLRRHSSDMLRAFRGSCTEDRPGILDLGQDHHIHPYDDWIVKFIPRRIG